MFISIYSLYSDSQWFVSARLQNEPGLSCKIKKIIGNTIKIPLKIA